MTFDSDSDQPETDGSRCGYVAIVGRPNVGKSTLLNHILGQKISITSRKPQTTRNAVVGIKTEGDVQIIFVDTPGMHLGQQKAINRYMNKAATSAMKDVDVVVFVIDRFIWTEEDEAVAEKLQHLKCPVILAVNKVDQIDDKETLLPHLQTLSEKLNFAEIVPMSALRNTNLDRLEQLITERLPQGIHMYPEDQITDRSSRFMAAEIVREKITRQLGDELPYEMAVEIEEFKQEGNLLNISALILVERDGQKKILIGDKGSRIKLIGTEARGDMEKLFEMKIMLKLWVKVKSGWSDDERALRSLGYNEF
jgi:GTPase